MSSIRHNRKSASRSARPGRSNRAKSSSRKPVKQSRVLTGARHSSDGISNERTVSTSHSVECSPDVIESLFDRTHPVPETVDPNDYQQQSRRPIVCLAFVVPLVLLYELGVIFLRADSQRSGVDYWVQQLLSSVGGGHLVVLPLVTFGILLSWHHRLHQRWQFKPATIGWMWFEAAGLGALLFFAAKAASLLLLNQTPGTTLGLLDAIRDPLWCSTAVSCLGAGIYEELFFRVLIFLPLISLLERKLNDNVVALVASMFIVSALFSALHYDVANPAGEPFHTATFLFRFAGSMALCALFKYRGFAIAVGVHVVFDILMSL